MEATVKTAGHVVGVRGHWNKRSASFSGKDKPNFSYTIISQEKEVVRLGEEEFKDNILKPEAMERAIFVCGKFANLAKTYGASEIIAVGTSAIREAQNQCEFLEKLHNETGLNVNVISGLEEARLICLGVSSGIDIGEEKAIFIDLGGGSTEIAVGNQHECFSLDSLKTWSNQVNSQIHRRRLDWPHRKQRLQTDQTIRMQQSSPVESEGLESTVPDEHGDHREQ